MGIIQQYIKSVFVTTAFIAFFIFGIAAILMLIDYDARAHAACQLNLPTGTVTMTVDVHEYKSCDQLPTFSGYLDAALSDVPDGGSIDDGIYASLCASLDGYILDNPMFGNVVYQVQLLSSTENPAFANRPWDKINYILTHYPIPQNSWLDVQAAVWTLIHGCTPQSDPALFDCQPLRAAPNYFPLGPSSPYGCPPDGIVNKANVAQIVADANSNGVGFVPGNGNHFAIIINPQSCTGNSSSYCADPHQPFQILFTSTICAASYTVTPSAGSNGTITPSAPQTVSHNETASFTVTPAAGYHAVMSGSCGGSLVGNTYTTNPITADCTVTASFAVDALIITTSSLPSGSLDTPYSQTLAASGGITPYSWSLSSGNLPNSLNLSSGGVISGTPTASGTSSFIAQVTDAASSTDTKNLSITINADNARVIGAPPIGTATIQEAYDICPTGGTVQIQALDFIENLVCDHAVSVKLEGGYDTNYTNNSSYTVITGSMTVRDGSVVVENIIVK